MGSRKRPPGVVVDRQKQLDEMCHAGPILRDAVNYFLVRSRCSRVTFTRGLAGGTARPEFGVFRARHRGRRQPSRPRAEHGISKSGPKERANQGRGWVPGIWTGE